VGSEHVSWHAPWSNEVWARSFFTNQMNYEKFKNWKFNLWSSQTWSHGSSTVKSNFNKSWIKWSAKSHSQQGEKLWSWAKKLPLQVLDKWSPSDTKVSYKSWSMLRLKSALNEVQFKGSELQWNKDLCAISEVNLQTWNCKVTQVNMKSQPSHAQKRSEVLLHHLPKFKSQTCSQVLLLRKKFFSKFPSAFFTSESRSWLSTYEVENIGWLILKFNFLLVFSTKSPMLSEVAGPCRSSSWQKQEVSNEVPFANWKERSMLKIHTATSSVQLYLLSGRSSSCALPSWSPILRICSSTLSIRAQDLAMQYWSCFTRSSSSWRFRSNSNCKYSPCCCVNQVGNLS